MSEQGIIDIIRQAYIDGWANTPIPALSLSAGGLVALADLHTVAKRTVIKGGSSWLDALVLAPGLHYQQAADALDRDSAAGLSAELGLTAAVETTADGKTVQHHKINNVALTNFLKRVAINGPKDETVTLNVGAMKQREEVDVLIRKFNAIASRRSRKTMATTQQGEEDCVPDETDREDADILSHLLYLASPLLTVSSSTLMAVLGDWWGVGFIVALMASRLINIWIIKQRVKTGIDIPTIPEPTLDPITPQLASVPSGSSSTVAAASVGEDKTTAEQKEEAAEPITETNPATEYTIELGGKRKVVLRGLTNDLQALTSPTFLRNKTDMDGYLEAVAKLIVYMVASFSGNLSQSGAIVLMVLLLSSAGLLGLSNAHVRDLQMNGRVARPDMPLRGDADEESGRRTGIPVENLRGRRVKTT